MYLIVFILLIAFIIAIVMMAVVASLYSGSEGLSQDILTFHKKARQVEKLQSLINSLVQSVECLQTI